MRAGLVFFIPGSALVLLALSAQDYLLEFFPYFLLSLLSGLLLILPERKYWRLSWLVCLFQFAVILALSVRVDNEWGLFQLLKFVNATFNLLGLFLTWKFNPFPYIERFFPGARVPAIRHSLMSPMTFVDYPDLLGQTMDLSETGCKTSFDVGDEIPFQLKQELMVHFPLISKEIISARVVAIEKPFVRFEYIEPRPTFVKSLLEFIAESQNQIKKLPEITIHEDPSKESS